MAFDSPLLLITYVGQDLMSPWPKKKRKKSSSPKKGCGEGHRVDPAFRWAAKIGAVHGGAITKSQGNRHTLRQERLHALWWSRGDCLVLFLPMFMVS